jgi:2-succinyl-6-hydroxy-2,4-cyclohexadiene-1-carboxylate synthase
MPPRPLQAAPASTSPVKAEHLYAEVMDGAPGAACLLIHGFMSSRAQWLLNIEAIRAVCRPVVVELWGHGRSPSPQDPSLYTIESLCAEFELLRERLRIQEWFVIGQSMGAGLALHYAHAYPARVRGVVLTNSAAALSTPEAFARQASQVSLARLEHGGADARDTLESMPMHVKHARRIPQPVKAQMLADADLLNPRAIAMLMKHGLPSLSALGFLGRLTLPALLLNGRFESKFQPLRDLALTLLPTLEVVDLEGGHCINVECADAANAAVVSFFERLIRPNEPAAQAPKQQGLLT